MELVWLECLVGVGGRGGGCRVRGVLIVQSIRDVVSRCKQKCYVFYIGLFMF